MIFVRIREKISCPPSEIFYVRSMESTVIITLMLGGNPFQGHLKLNKIMLALIYLGTKTGNFHSLTHNSCFLIHHVFI